jgi:hypothetical protein
MKRRNSAPDHVAQEIADLYRDTNTSVDEICSTYNVSVGQVYRIVARHNIPKRNPSFGNRYRKNGASQVQPTQPARPTPATGVNPFGWPTTPAQQDEVRKAFSTLPPAPGESPYGYPAGTAPGRPPTPRLAVTVDRNGTVVEAKRETAIADMPEWEVTVQVVTTATRRLRALNIEEAIHRAKTDPQVRRVVGIKEVE